MIQISNCPDTNLQRFITHKNLFFYEITKQVILECHISHYKDGVIVENSRISSYKRNLVATNDTPVNIYTGALVTETLITVNEIVGYDVDENPIYETKEVISTELSDIFKLPNVVSEYQFFKNLKTIPIIQEDMELSIIQLRDSQGKFNI